ncbi:hypothetical protein [Aureliella helgolandensis]|uniref:hypothetical protein n=1 Tax=Aureliella helgolandensis TaxID=2527968 RepID=UPI0011A3ACF0|nr:hypothetical protein [Aureliella helgolandensis]
MRQAYLQEFSEYSGLILTRMFDFTRFRSNKSDGWGDSSEETLVNQDLIRGRLNVQQTLGSYSRGLQVIPLSQSSGRAKKRYETFIAQDLRHHATGEFSCDPDKLSNYFLPTDSPHELSPAFFRPEVLSKYKADTQKYRIEERRINCRGAWTLEHFGINDAGQIHAYLMYLGRLPHKEQLHWKSFNEPPKTGLTAHTVATDFEGAFVEIDDPLQNLKRQLAKLERHRVGWWKLRALDLPRCAQYPVTDSRDEWASELMNLDKLLVEGFVHKWLRRMACSLARELDEKWQSLQLLHECLVGQGFEEEASRQITAPLRQVHMYRSRLKGHASESEPRELEAAARREFGDLRNHFRELCSKCDESIRVITSAFAGGL